MAQIVIEVPDEKVDLIVDAVIWYLRDTEVPITTTAEAVNWIKGRLKHNIKKIVMQYQFSKYEKEFVFNDPLE